MTLIRSRAVSPVDIAGAALDRIALLHDQLLAFCAVDAELVLDQARQAERSLIAGDAVGPLCGGPLGVKEIIFTRDLPTVGGSQFYRDFTPREDDIVVERLRAGTQKRRVRHDAQSVKFPAHARWFERRLGRRGGKWSGSSGTWQ